MSLPAAFQYWPVCLYVLDEDGSVQTRYETGIKLSALAAWESAVAEWSAAADAAQQEIPVIAIGIENPESKEPAVYLDMDVERQELRYVLN